MENCKALRYNMLDCQGMNSSVSIHVFCGVPWNISTGQPRCDCNSYSHFFSYCFQVLLPNLI